MSQSICVLAIRFCPFGFVSIRHLVLATAFTSEAPLIFLFALQVNRLQRQLLLSLIIILAIA